MNYSGEHTLLGQLGHISIVLSFVLASLGTIAYFLATRSPEHYLRWIKPARYFFLGHVITSLFFIALIFYGLLNHYYEYEYIWEQASEDMSFRYLLVCFWGGQQGSFMLWIFWHLVLGSILLFSSKKWEPYVMAVFCLIQVFLVSMLLGVYIGDWKIGSSPFALRRMTNPTFGPLWSAIPDYFIFDDNIKSGRGLNPLLRNYWMTIHPPTLFLGFGLTAIPFCYAVAALWSKRLTEWIKPALPWTFIGIMVLGAGILMGGVWAYESLSFGGFWAWDPVENASLVPWIIMIGAGHLLLINRHTQTSLYSGFIFSMLTFILILLSTFLTRSGVLGDTSVHSFTGQDMMGQLMLYLLFFIWLMVHLLLFNFRLRIAFGLISLIILIAVFLFPEQEPFYKTADVSLTVKSILFSAGFLISVIFLILGYSFGFPSNKNEEHFSAREFWMFIGSIILLLSGFHIIYNTCLPVLNMVFGTTMAIPADERNGFYNQYQVPFAVVIALLIAFTQFLKYKKSPSGKFFRDILFSLGISLAITGFLVQSFDFGGNVPHILLLFTSIFAVIANLDYWLRITKGSMGSMGSSVAHVGFGLVLLGSLISQGKQEVISKNYKGYVLDFLSKDGGIKNEEDVQLFKGELTSMGEYFVVYRGKRFDNKEGHLTYDIDYLEQLPLEYKKGDRVRFNFNVYECNTTHEARPDFMLESGFWKMIEVNDSKEYYNYPLWESKRPGKHLFTLHPFVQLNKMTNVAEPGTQHFWSHDIFTHIKYADLSPLNSGRMQSFKLNGKVGDTLWTAGYKVIIEDVGKIEADTSGKLGAKLGLKIYHILDNQIKFPFRAEPVYLIDSTGKVDNPVSEVKAFGLEFKITSIDPGNHDEHDSHNHSAEESGKFEMEFSTPEYIVLHATKFPYIFILWWGTIIMCLGTLIAVVHRIKKQKIGKAEI